jgi:hypothetical protein
VKLPQHPGEGVVAYTACCLATTRTGCARSAPELPGTKKVPEKPSPARRKKGQPAIEDSPAIGPEPDGTPETPARGKMIEDKHSMPAWQATKPADLIPESTIVASNKAAHPFFSAGRNKIMPAAPLGCSKRSHEDYGRDHRFPNAAAVTETSWKPTREKMWQAFFIFFRRFRAKPSCK